MEEFRKKLKEIIAGSKKVVLSSHMSPDDDAIGSMLALYSYLSKEFPDKDIQMIYTGFPVDRYVSFVNYDQIKFVSDLSEYVLGCDVFIGLDGSRFDRFSKNPLKLKDRVGKTIFIDHHGTEPDVFDLACIQEATSTAEIIYQLFYESQEISKDVAEVLFLGLLGDTGNFSFLKKDQSYVFSIAQILQAKIETGVQEFQARYSLNSQKVFELVKVLIVNTKYIEIPGWPKCMYTLLGRKDIESGNYNEEEITNAKHWYMFTYLRNIKDYPWGFVISAKSDGKCGITLRSLPENVNVRDIVEKLGIGGGHNLAAGGTFPLDDPEKCATIFFEWLSKNDNIV